MAEVFLSVVNRGLSASFLVLAVIAARFLLKKGPRWMLCALWGLVALRLLCPFSLESPLSLVPTPEPVSSEAVFNTVEAVPVEELEAQQSADPILTELLPYTQTPLTPAQIWTAALSVVWGVGMGLMALYAIVSYFRLSRRVKGAVRLDGNLFRCDAIPTPSVLGVLRPRIFLPNTLSREDMPYVIAHERAHLKRKDHLWKLFAFGLLSVYWFQPLLWLSYILFCRDMELACDEKVAASLSRTHRANYSQALLNCASGRRFPSACPVAFGEVGVKERVKRVLSFRRPTLWAILGAVLACAVTTLCFVTNPVTPEASALPLSELSITASDVTHTGLTLTYHPENGFQEAEGYTDGIYWLEKQDGDSWQVVQPSQWVESALGAVEAPRQRTIHVRVTDNGHRALDWSTLLGYLDGGQYRVCISFWTEEGQERTFYAPFTLEDMLATPWETIQNLRSENCSASFRFTGQEPGDLTRKQIQTVIEILKSIPEEEYYAGASANEVLSVIRVTCGDLILELRYDGAEVQLLLDSRSAEGLTDTRWVFVCPELNAFFDDLPAG